MQNAVDQAAANGLTLTVNPADKPFIVVFFDRSTNTWISTYPVDANVAKSILGTERAKGMTIGNFGKVSQNDPNYDATSPENTGYGAEYAAAVAAELAAQGC